MATSIPLTAMHVMHLGELIFPRSFIKSHGISIAMKVRVIVALALSMEPFVHGEVSRAFSMQTLWLSKCIVEKCRFMGLMWCTFRRAMWMFLRVYVWPNLVAVLALMRTVLDLVLWFSFAHVNLFRVVRHIGLLMSTTVMDRPNLVFCFDHVGMTCLTSPLGPTTGLMFLL